MYNLYEYISECAIDTAFSNVPYRSSCSTVLTVRLTSAERAMSRRENVASPFLYGSHISKVLALLLHLFSKYSLLSNLVSEFLMRSRFILQRSRHNSYLPSPLIIQSRLPETHQCSLTLTKQSEKHSHGTELVLWVAPRPFSRTGRFSYHDPSIQAVRYHSPWLVSLHPYAVVSEAYLTRLCPSATSTLSCRATCAR
jgi:hypothetical protein